MYVYNVTFVTATGAGERFLSWMRGSALPALTAEGYGASAPRLMKVAEAGGEKPGEEHGLSTALHMEFESEENARRWHDTLLPSVLLDFNRQFGPEAAFFITLLECLPL